MQKSDIRILIIKYDPTLGRAVEYRLKRSCYQTQLTTNYSDSINAAKLVDFHGVVADCMLPQKSGVDIAAEIKNESGHDVVVILTSGIFKDKVFARDAIMKTKAKTFLHKPFDIEELISNFDEAFGDIIDGSIEPLHQLLCREQYSPRDRISAINRTEYAHGFDLPFIYSLLLENQIVGTLEIQYDEGSVPTKIGFHKGRIDQVQYPDTESYFGVLLIEKGFTTKQELNEGLNQQNEKPIGQRLVDSSSLSPHAIDIIQHEQMIIRLSKTIQDTSVKICFTEEKRSEPSVFIDGILLTQLLSDWICSKLTSGWLHTFYTPWLESPVLKGPESNKINLLKELPAAKPFADFIAQNNWPYSLQSLLADDPKTENEFLRAFHFFALQRMVVFGSSSNTVENFEIKTARLNKILAGFDGKNYYEILGVSRKAKPTEINRSYHDLAKSLHPDKLHKDSPKELRDLSQNIFSKITVAYQTLNSEASRAAYNKTLEMGQAEDILKAESSFEEALRCLRSSRFREARKAFERTLSLKGARSDTMVYFLWAYIKEKRNRANHVDVASKVSACLNKVPHEDRHSAHYFFVKGLYYDLIGQAQKAYKHHQHCLAMDPYFNDAKRELTFIKRSFNAKKSMTLTDDLSMVVTKLFGKKSG
ncbi:MAG: DnaJ domain-containing protein [Bdellovibrionales bacterium]|nr:DnaJ domain-containing protein [Bdellovibrionales bacterium]